MEAWHTTESRTAALIWHFVAAFSCCNVFAEMNSKHGVPESCLNAVRALQGHLKLLKGHHHHSQKISAEPHLQIR